VWRTCEAGAQQLGLGGVRHKALQHARPRQVLLDLQGALDMIQYPIDKFHIRSDWLIEICCC